MAKTQPAFAKMKDQNRKQQIIALLVWLVQQMNNGAPGAYLNAPDVEEIRKYEPKFLSDTKDTNQNGQQLVGATSLGVAFVQALGNISQPAAPAAPAAPSAPAPVMGGQTPAAPSPGVSSAPAGSGNGTPKPNTTGFAIQSGIPAPPPSTNRPGFGAREEVYPFSQCNTVGDSFFVPTTPERPEPAKSLSSSVAAATRRFAKVYPEGHKLAGQATGKDGRKFIVRPRNMKEHGEEGARVWRVQ